MKNTVVIMLFISLAFFKGYAENRGSDSGNTLKSSEFTGTNTEGESETKRLRKFTVSGQIKDDASGEDLIGATVFAPALNLGAASNVYGFYSLTIDEGQYELVFSYVGYEDQIVSIDLTQNVIYDIHLKEGGALLGEVIITAEKEKAMDHITSTEMSAIEVDIETVKKLPALFGEVDIIKTIQLLPGVKTVGEGSSGFYVRGGNVDQNLILLDEAPIYNASHVLGFFSSFNPDAIKDMKLYKGAIPANFGGRLSSVLDIRMKEGNSKNFAASGGIGTFMSRLAVEAPLWEGGSFILAGRRSYLDVLAKTFQAARGNAIDKDNKFFFYDLNAKVNHRINNKNRIFASGYFGRDVLAFDLDDEDFRVQWGNATATFRWNHIFSPKVFSNLTYYYSNYDYFFEFDEDITRFKWDSRLREHSIKADFGAFLNPTNTLGFGIHIIQHNISPGDIKSIENEELIEEFNIQTNKSYESAIYLNNEQSIGDKLKIDYGVRFTFLQNVGPQEVYRLDENYEITDTLQRGKGVYNTYPNLNPRVGLRYKLSPSSSVKASYSRTTQYIQLASNGNFSTPFDIWFPSSEQIKPQLADQVAVGYFKNLKNNTISFSAELYYKKLSNSIDFKDHAELLLNTNLEADLRIGKGRAYGLELMAKKNKGRLTGWVSYTYSKAEKNIETINNGNWYNAKHDKPHDISVVASYELNDRLSLGSSFVYSTGNAVTFPTGRFDFFGETVPVYTERNSARLPDYHRLDLSATVRSRKNQSRRLQTEWVFGIYNAYNRKNAFAIRFKGEPTDSNATFAEKQSIFSIVPSITFNAKF